MRELDLDLSCVDLGMRADGRPLVRMITAFGRTQTIVAWSAETGVPYARIYARLRSGHTPETAVTPRRPYKAARIQEGAYKPVGAFGAASWATLAWDEDPCARRVVAEFGALSSDTLAKLFGVSRQRVNQIERAAFAKLRIAIALVELLGLERAAKVFEALRGKSLAEYEARLRAVRKENS